MPTTCDPCPGNSHAIFTARSSDWGRTPIVRLPGSRRYHKLLCDAAAIWDKRRVSTSPFKRSATTLALDSAARPRSGRPQGKFTQHRRMAELQQLLYQQPKGVTIHEIAAHLGVTTRSARRYLKEVSLDLEAVSEQPNGLKRWRIPPVDVPRRVAMRRTQAYALLAARTLFEPMRGSTLFEEIDLAAETLIGVACRPGRGPNAGVADARLEQRFRYVSFAPKDYREQADDLDNLFQAVADLRPVSLRYPRASDGELERLLVHPYALLLYKDAIIALAFDTNAGDVRSLALDHVSDSRLRDDERFRIPDGFDVERYLQGQFGIWCADDTTEVVIDFHEDVAEVLTTRSIHPSQRIEALDDGSVRLRMQLGQLSEVAHWVLGFGAAAVVREPAALRDEVRRALSDALAGYGD
jgi:predicted DNA-binding transcriptional regulator YafY